jgi:hypothetical protein
MTLQEPRQLSLLTTDQILAEMEAIQERWDSLQIEIVGRVKDAPTGTAALAHMETDDILTAMEECQEAWDILQDEIIARAKKWGELQQSLGQ